MGFSQIAQALPRLWYRQDTAPILLPLWPFACLFGGLVRLRRLLYGMGWLPSFRLPVPVIVVGNLTVGGSGKTPLVLWLIEQLRGQGARPGIISRGYQSAASGVHAVSAASSAAGAGDEPLLLARRSGVPVFCGRDRVATGRALLAAHPECTVIVSDDGLQHYRMERDAEIAVFDGRGAGNGRLLPAGPLREPLSRLSGVSAIVWNAGSTGVPERLPGVSTAQVSAPQFAMRLVGRDFVSLADPSRSCSAGELRGKRLYALAGIGDPSRFFSHLEAMGLRFVARAFPDHHGYTVEDLDFARDGLLLMTEKDGVKCAALALPGRELWVLPVQAVLDAAQDGRTLSETLLEKLNGRTAA